VSKLDFYVYFPELLNLNGDLANVDILVERLSWNGMSASVHHLDTQTPKKADAIFLGHGSIDAWRHINEIYPTLFSDLADAVRSNIPVFAFGSGAEQLHFALGTKFARGERVSEFINSNGVVGYLNSETDLPPVSNINNSLLILLHGPVFAKNPDWVDEMCINLKWITQKADNPKMQRIDSLAKASRVTAFEH